MNKKILLLTLLILTGFLSCYDGLMDTYDNSKLYNLRDRGPAGGWIFYINPNWEQDGWRYLEAAPVSTEWTSKSWSTNTTVFIGSTAGDPPRLTAIGTGKANTAAIVAWLNANGQTGCAAQLCDSLDYGGYNDWFLPSIDECYEMCWVLHSRGPGTTDNPAYGTNRVGDFTNNRYYWSSSELSVSNSYAQYFLNGVKGNGFKNVSSVYTRAIRAF